jgi:hypothetical protein
MTRVNDPPPEKKGVLVGEGDGDGDEEEDMDGWYVCLELV